MLRDARARLAALPIMLCVVGVGGGCVREPEAPAIAFSYNFGDTLFEGFLMDELERTRPDGGRRIRVMGGSTSFRGGDGSSLSAEVRRATVLAEDRTVIVAVGPGGSREALQVAPIYRDAGLAELLPTATSRALSAAGATALLLAANDSLQGAFIPQQGGHDGTAPGARWLPWVSARSQAYPSARCQADAPVPGAQSSSFGP